MSRRKSLLLGRQVWCTGCMRKIPPEIKPSDFLVPFREKHYDLAGDGLNIDARMIGVCNDCLTRKNDFQRSNKEQVDINHKHLVYTVPQYR